jgi:4-deoxy-L-threo-5-hexosulose-uronate ketol-isomerase
MENSPMLIRRVPSLGETAALDTAGLRAGFLLDDLFAPDEVRMVLTDLDRAVTGAACPTVKPLDLPVDAELRAASFCERREIGIINLGGPGTVAVGGIAYPLEARECLYAGRGSGAIQFSSNDKNNPAAFYFVSYPAHASYPTVKAGLGNANQVSLGSKAEANERTLYQYIHEGGIKSCQLVMGFTELAPGSVWNTMPCHTHERRTEIYCYFDIPAGHAVLHIMGAPQETRPLWIGNRQAALSPAWSVHSGAGTANYRFVWAMGGENQRFDDMDKVAIPHLR